MGGGLAAGLRMSLGGGVARGEVLSEPSPGPPSRWNDAPECCVRSAADGTEVKLWLRSSEVAMLCGENTPGAMRTL